MTFRQHYMDLYLREMNLGGQLGKLKAELTLTGQALITAKKAQQPELQEQKGRLERMVNTIERVCFETAVQLADKTCETLGVDPEEEYVRHD